MNHILLAIIIMFSISAKGIAQSKEAKKHTKLKSSFEKNTLYLKNKDSLKSHEANHSQKKSFTDTLPIKRDTLKTKAPHRPEGKPNRLAGFSGMKHGNGSQSSSGNHLNDGQDHKKLPEKPKAGQVNMKP